MIINQDVTDLLFNGISHEKAYFNGSEVYSSVKLPGPSALTAGNMEAGFYGEVSGEDLINYKDLANMVGVTNIDLAATSNQWLKLSSKRKTLFVSKQILKTSVSPNYLIDKNIVYGDKIINIQGVDYKIRLLKGANSDPAPKEIGPSDVNESEWDRLILPLTNLAPDGFDANFTVMPTADFGIDYTYTNLNTNIYTICQEYMPNTNNLMGKIVRGYNAKPETISTHLLNNAYSPYGWRPVLEAVR